MDDVIASNEAVIRLGFFFGIFLLMAGWEVLAPRRRLTQSKGVRWLNNIGLVVLNTVTFQPLDMLTLLGFVILIGIVVNNAILLVHQTLHHLREEGRSPAESILLATRHRVRPIFMSTLTSVFGMLPLVLFPGAGSELYRGLGSVVVGGLALSALLTLMMVPPLLSVLVAPLERRRLAKQDANSRPAAASLPGE